MHKVNNQLYSIKCEKHFNKFEQAILNYIKNNKDNKFFKIKVSGNVDENDKKAILDHAHNNCKILSSAIEEIIGKNNVSINYILNEVFIIKEKLV